MSYSSRTLSSLLGIAVAGTAYVYAYSARPVTRPDMTATGVPLVKDVMFPGLDKSVAPPRVGAYFASSRVEHARTATPAIAADRLTDFVNESFMIESCLLYPPRPSRNRGIYVPARRRLGPVRPRRHPPAWLKFLTRAFRAVEAARRWPCFRGD